jgi:tRNA pseudouridine55 synthase
MKHGCLVIDKPPGMTSHDVVARCRKQLGIKKIGHTGTLDPDATGVLVVCVGQATKIIPYLEEADKGYVATVVFGTSTTTLDAAGEVTKRVPIASLFPVDPALAKLTTIDALKPPQVSAIKVAGKKLYEHARKGNVIDVPARPMKVLELEVLTPLQLHDDQAMMTLYLRVSKGSYIRSMVEYLGEQVGLPAHLGSLRRTHSGIFTIEQSIPLADVTSTSPLLPIEQALGFPQVELDEPMYNDVRLGKPILNEHHHTGYVTLMKHRPQAIYLAEGDWLVPARVFVYEDSSHSSNQ